MSSEEMNRPAPPQPAAPIDEAMDAPRPVLETPEARAPKSSVPERGENESTAEYTERVRKAADEKFRAENPWLYEEGKTPEAKKQEDDKTVSGNSSNKTDTPSPFDPWIVIPSIMAVIIGVTALAMLGTFLSLPFPYIAAAISAFSFTSAAKIVIGMVRYNKEKKASLHHKAPCDDKLNDGKAGSGNKGRAESMLFQAIRNENCALVGKLLEVGSDPNVRDCDGDTPLIHAVRDEDMRLARILLKHKADPNVRDNAGKTPLFSAVNDENAALVKLLLEAGADPNARNSEGETPLFPAVRDENATLVKLLLEAEADPNAFNSEGETPLFPAVRDENIPIVRMLLEAGADANRQDTSGKTPLQIAVDDDADEIATLLLRHGAVDPATPATRHGAKKPRKGHGQSPRPKF